MSYIASDTGYLTGAPIELYTFFSDAFTSPYTYTSYDEDVNHNALVYVSIPITRSQPELSQEFAAQSLSITVPRDNELARLWINRLPPRIVWVKVERLHSSDGPTPEVVVFWQGRVRGVVWEGNTAAFECQPLNNAFDRNGLRVWYSPICPYMLYHPDTCKVPAASFVQTATITGINGLTLTSAEFGVFPNTNPVPTGWWTAGFVETSDGELRYVSDHGGAGNTVITLTAPFESSNLQIGDVVNIYAGCDRKYPTCLNKFNNLSNFGGWPFVPGKNPFQYPINT